MSAGLGTTTALLENLRAPKQLIRSLVRVIRAGLVVVRRAQILMNVHLMCTTAIIMRLVLIQLARSVVLAALDGRATV
jgi:hypothetical protein